MKYEEAEALAIDRMVDPPLVAPSAAYDKLDLMPGGISFFDEQTGSQGVRSLYEHMSVPVQALDMKIAVIQERIKSVFFNDLFLMISMADKSGVTAREIAAKESEKLIMLGPVLESASEDFSIPVSTGSLASRAVSGCCLVRRRSWRGCPCRWIIFRF